MVGSVTSNPYATAYVPTATTTAANTATANANAKASGSSNASSVNVTLSAEAQAALAAQTDSRTIDAVIANARTALDKMLSDAKATSALQDGKATIDMSGLDRRSLYAVA